MNFPWKSIKETSHVGAGTAEHDGLLAEISRLQSEQACARLGSVAEGLSETEASARLDKFGPNLVARERKATIPEELWSRARNPLNALLLTLAAVSIPKTSRNCRAAHPLRRDL